ncbi:hypothetical protein QMZ93_07505 [Pantoea stewartii subsp. indologenes]|uniref:hypothetical protein n=1 Tax=Pantoea stewartii TaxID=66269 RepID=UPI00197FD610|nr:hypothetical protein [Pantoea stewartii]MDK2633189.1 hypothetical protein [Pantoea stewartii subsp. indologenes]
MKKALILALAALFLSACDNKNSENIKVQDAPKAQAESAKFTCVSGNISTECEIVAGDQLGSGKWRHAKLNMSGSDASLNIDGEVFYKTDVSSAFVDGKRVVNFELLSPKKSRAEVNLESSNSESSLRVNAWNSDNKLMLTSSR